MLHGSGTVVAVRFFMSVSNDTVTQGAHIEVRDSELRTALIIAASHGHSLSCIRMSRAPTRRRWGKTTGPLAFCVGDVKMLEVKSM